MVRDLYRNFEALRANRTENEDYRIAVRNSENAILIMAPHGGLIEPDTSEIARAIAAEDFSLFMFEGLRRRPHHELHITSSRYDEPTALRMARESNLILAIHGCKDRKRGKHKDPMCQKILIGGRDEAARQRLQIELRRARFPCRIAADRLSGMDRANICNRGRTGRGVQLEIPRSVRRSLLASDDALARFVGAIRAALSPDRQMDGEAI